MAFELSAVIRLRDEFTKNMNRARKSVESMQKSAEKATRISANFDRIGSSLTNKITKPALLATSALAGLTMVKGFNRLIGIDTAQAKLQALGHDAAAVESIMASALASVKGTAYGLDVAATTAASAVAAGIGPGEELTRYLSLTADAAAIAGAGMDEMGSIFNKVQTANRAYNGELQQLADRGLPIYQWLAREAGVAEGSIRDMAANGQISSQMFLKAIENNIGGVAKTMGEKSFSAAVANIGADISRIGAAFLGAGSDSNGFFSTVKPLLTDFRGLLSQIEEKAVVWGEKFGEAFNNFITKIQNVKAWFDSLSPAMQSVITKSLGIGTAVAIGIGPALKIVGALASGFKMLATVAAVMAKPLALVFTVLTTVIKGAALAVTMLTRAMLMNPIGLIITGVVALIAGIVLLIKNWDAVKQKVTEVVASIISGLLKVLAWFKELPGRILKFGKGMFTAGKNLFKSVWDGMKGIWKKLGNWVSSKVKWLTDKLMFWRKSNKEMAESTDAGTTVASAAVDGSHYNGLWRVPFDGYIARLHKGERVLTANQTDAFDGLLSRLRGNNRPVLADTHDVFNDFTYEQVSGQTVNNVTNNSYSTVNNASGDRKASGPASVTVTGNTFIVRQESDIKAIAGELLNGMKLAWEAGA